MKIRFGELTVADTFQFAGQWFRKTSDRQAKAVETRRLFLFNAGDLVTKSDPDPDDDDDYDPMGAWIAAQHAQRQGGGLGDDDGFYDND